MREGFIVESPEECAAVLAAEPGVHVLAVCHGETACRRPPESVAVAAVFRRLPVTLAPGAALIGGRGFRRLRLRNGADLVALPRAGAESFIAGRSFRYVWPCPSGTELDAVLREALIPGVEDARRED